MSCPAAKSIREVEVDGDVRRCPAGLVMALHEELCVVCGGCSSCCVCTPEELGEVDEIVDETDRPDPLDDDRDPQSPIEMTEATLERWDFDRDPDWR